MSLVLVKPDTAELQHAAVLRQNIKLNELREKIGGPIVEKERSPFTAYSKPKSLLFF